MNISLSDTNNLQSFVNKLHAKEKLQKLLTQIVEKSNTKFHYMQE